jgi:hypothetical protein
MYAREFDELAATGHVNYFDRDDYIRDRVVQAQEAAKAAAEAALKQAVEAVEAAAATPAEPGGSAW